MKFGKLLRDSAVKAWLEAYIDYKTLKALLVDIEATRFKAESRFVEYLDKEISKCNAFYVSTLKKITEQLRAKPSAQQLSELGLQLIQISEFAYINAVGFKKILKKHDRVSVQKMQSIMLFKLQPEVFCPKPPLEEALCLLADLYESRMEHKAAMAGEKKYSESVFTRKSLKFWIRLSDVSEVICQIIPHLPIYHYKGHRDHTIASPITSLYLDSENFDCYRLRLEKQEGATLVRVRWYGAGSPSGEVFMERKQHHESWVQEVSSKTRFKIAAADVFAYLKGAHAGMPTAAVGGNGEKGKVKKDKEKEKEKEKVEAAEEVKPLVQLGDTETPHEGPLYFEIQDFVRQNKLQPMLRTQYLRTAFQLHDDNRVRISLDTDVSMIREHVDFQREWYVTEERTHEVDVHRFPFAILEVKLQESADMVQPAWVTQLMASKLLIPAEKFSKYAHGVAVLYPHKTTMIPYWLDNAVEELVDAADVAQSHIDPHASSNGVVGRVTTPPPRSPRSSIGKLRSTWGSTASGLIGGGGAGVGAGAPHTTLNLGDALGGRGGGGGGGGDGGDGGNDGVGYDMRDEADRARGQRSNAFARLFRWCCPPPTGAKQTQNRMKIEPKTFFANERTYLQWFNAATLLGSLSLALITLDTHARIIGLIFLPIAVLLLLYALYTYHHRLRSIQQRRITGYHDPYGPTILTIVLAVAISLSGFLTVLYKTPGTKT